MSKRASAKYKIDRRMGESIWGRNKSPVNKRSYGPGQHGQRRAKKLSDYGTQLQAKQKLKGVYGNITERQFRKYYTEASRRPGDTGENMIGLLERRLDSVVYRAKFVPTPFSARQLVSHGHVKVNGRRVTVASYQVKEGDAVELTAKARDMALVIDASKSPERDTPDYVEVNHDKMSVKFVRTPKLADVPYAAQMQPHLIVEFYSR
jgi:small subunit ribosomal protein S4